MKNWIISVGRELEEPALFYVNQEHRPNETQIRQMFVDAGYEDDWGYIGKIRVIEGGAG